MMAKFVFAVLAVLAVSAMGELTPQPVFPCPTYDLSGENLGATPGFIPNILFYNAANLMGGNPQGPWFRLNAGGCKWSPAIKDFQCDLTLFQDAARTQQIGTGKLYSNATFFIDEQPNGYIGGDLILQETINALLVTTGPVPNTNYVTRQTIIHFEPKQTYPDPTTLQPAQANKASFSVDKRTGTLTLWGSNGWNGQAFVGQTTGLDFRADFKCPDTPIIEPCTPDPGSSFTVAYACVPGLVRFHSSTTTIGLSFTSGPAGVCHN